MLPPILASMLDFYLDAYERFLGVRQCALHDRLPRSSRRRQWKWRLSIVRYGWRSSRRGRSVAALWLYCQRTARRWCETGSSARSTRVPRDAILHVLRTHAWPREAPDHLL